MKYSAEKAQKILEAGTIVPHYLEFSKVAFVESSTYWISKSDSSVINAKLIDWLTKLKLTTTT